MLFISVIRDFKNLGFQSLDRALLCLANRTESATILRASETNDILFQTSRFLFKPRPLPPLICSNRSMLCFRYTFSEYFLGLAPLLYCTTPPSQHISFALGRSVIIRAHDSASHSNSAQGTWAKQTGFQIASLEACPPCRPTSVLLFQARCRSHGRAHEILIVNSSKVVIISASEVRPQIQCCLGCSINRIILFKEVMFPLLESFCSQELALSTALLFLTNILFQTGNE